MGYPEDNFHGATGGRGKGLPGGGRKPKLVKKWLKDCHVSRADAVMMLKGILFGQSLAEAEARLSEDGDKVCVATYALIKAALRAAEKGNFGVIGDMLEFIYGKAVQPFEVSGAQAAVVILPPKDKDDGTDVGAPA